MSSPESSTPEADIISKQQGFSSAKSSSHGTSVFALAVASAWILGFLWLFFTETLPNNSTAERPISRLDIWALLLDSPFSLLNPLDYTWTDPDAALQNLTQRFPHFLTACLIWLSAWGWGVAVRVFLLKDISLHKTERLVVEGGLGLSLLSLWVLLVGVTGQMNAGAVLGPGFALASLSVLLLFRQRNQSKADSPDKRQPRSPLKLIDWILIASFGCFGLHLWLGTMTPAFDFDVREYHLQGPKEWWQAGQLRMLPHNVYTSFPFLSEMLCLAAIIIDGDPWQGAISGKATLGAFPLLTAAATYAIAARWLGRRTGLIASLILISTPWILRISIIAYAESAITFYLSSACMVALRFDSQGPDRVQRPLGLLAGLLAGSAMASKYPGIVSVIFPIGCLLTWTLLKGRRANNSKRGSSVELNNWKVAIHYLCGIAVAVSPWFIRNFSDTGNPVYPLVWSVLGGTDWDESLNEKWKAAHSAPDHNIAGLPQHLKDVALRSDWQNGLLFSLSLPAAILLFRRREIRLLSLHAAWLLASWWLLTHRIDRFWVPMIPIVAVIAASSFQLSTRRLWQAFIYLTVLIVCLFNYSFGRLDVIGFHAGLSDLKAAQERVVREDIAYLNAALPDDAVVLMVGEAEVFDCRFQTIYNTVFDRNLFQQWTSTEDDVIAGSPDADDHSLRPPREIYATLKKRQITHVYVNWLEILRYRLTYGFTPYVTPARFQELVENRVLLPGTITSTGEWSALSQQQLKQIESWNGYEALKLDERNWSSRMLYRLNPRFSEPTKTD